MPQPATDPATTIRRYLANRHTRLAWFFTQEVRASGRMVAEMAILTGDSMLLARSLTAYWRRGVIVKGEG